MKCKCKLKQQNCSSLPKLGIVPPGKLELSSGLNQKSLILRAICTNHAEVWQAQAHFCLKPHSRITLTKQKHSFTCVPWFGYLFVLLQPPKPENIKTSTVGTSWKSPQLLLSVVCGWADLSVAHHLPFSLHQKVSFLAGRICGASPVNICPLCC